MKSSSKTILAHSQNTTGLPAASANTGTRQKTAACSNPGTELTEDAAAPSMSATPNGPLLVWRRSRQARPASSKNNPHVAPWTPSSKAERDMRSPLGGRQDSHDKGFIIHAPGRRSQLRQRLGHEGAGWSGVFRTACRAQRRSAAAFGEAEAYSGHASRGSHPNCRAHCP